MKFFILAALFVATATATHRLPLATIEELDAPTSRIIDGEVAEPGQFPWQAVNRFRVSGGTAFCGAALICDQWVLTAGHCVDGAYGFTIYLGSVNQSQVVEPGRVIIESTESYSHENYSSWSLNNDIALVKLPQKVKFTDRIQPIPIGKLYVGAGENVTVSGWGKTSDASSQVSPVLNSVNLTTISNQECAAVYGSTVISSTLCARGRPQHSTCNGDSGGPLVQVQNGTTVQVGVVSFVHRAGCASGNPSGYVRTINYLDWILDKINGTCQLA